MQEAIDENDNALDYREYKFESILNGTFTNRYIEEGGRYTTLYETSKRLRWNPSIDIGWEEHRDEEYIHSDIVKIFEEFEFFQELNKKEKRRFVRDYQSWQISQFLHGEQGALIISSQLVSCTPDLDSKLFCSSQTIDEAHHVEAFMKYMELRKIPLWRVNNSLKGLLQKTLNEEKWDLKFIGMHIIIESVALASFATIRSQTDDPLLKKLLEYILKDESRHVNYGVEFLKNHLSNMREDELEERAIFAFKSCVLMKERLIPYDVFNQWKLDRNIAVKTYVNSHVVSEYKHNLFSKIIPLLNKIGLITKAQHKNYVMIGAEKYIDIQLEF